MRLDKPKPTLLQLVLIILVSAAASYAFQHTEIAYKIDGVCISRYIAYMITVFLGYVAFSRYKKLVGLTFSLALSVAALSPIGHKIIELFPVFAPFLAIVFGIITIVGVPSSRGRGYFEFIATLILPAVLAQSRIGGSLSLLATTESIGYNELSAIVVCVVGGYFFLRYSNLTDLNSKKLLANGCGQTDVLRVSTWSNAVAAAVVLCSSVAAVILMISVPILADAVRPAMLGSPAYIMGLTMVAGIVVVAIVHILSRSEKAARS